MPTDPRHRLAPLGLLLLGLVACAPARMDAADLALADGGAADLAGADLAMVAPIAFIDLDTLYQDCSLPTRPDPLLIKGRLSLRNQGGLPLGPITVPGGVIYSNKDGAELATFQLSDGALGTIPGDGSLDNKVIDKLAGSLMPSMQCKVVPCNESVRIELTLSGRNLPAGSKAKSAPTTVACAF